MNSKTALRKQALTSSSYEALDAICQPLEAREAILHLQKAIIISRDLRYINKLHSQNLFHAV